MWPGLRHLCLRKSLLYGVMWLFSMPLKTLRGARKTLKITHFCSISNMPSSLKIELVSASVMTFQSLCFILIFVGCCVSGGV